MNYSKDEIIMALQAVAEKYPAVYTHFFFAELDPKAYEEEFIKSKSNVEDSE